MKPFLVFSCFLWTAIATAWTQNTVKYSYVTAHFWQPTCDRQPFLAPNPPSNPLMCFRACVETTGCRRIIESHLGAMRSRMNELRNVMRINEQRTCSYYELPDGKRFHLQMLEDLCTTDEHGNFQCQLFTASRNDIMQIYVGVNATDCDEPQEHDSLQYGSLKQIYHVTSRGSKFADTNRTVYDYFSCTVPPVRAKLFVLLFGCN